MPHALRPSPLPKEFRQKVPAGALYFKLNHTVRNLNLNTVCEEAKCPNRTECYARGALTFQILGGLCTRRCGFCAEKTGKPLAADASEPARVLEAALKLKLSHIVITAPARDDLEDGGAEQFAKTVRLLKECLPSATVEILVSDLQGRAESLKTVLDAGPHVFNHNLETVRRLTPRARAKATYDGSLAVLKKAAERQPGIKTKSGLMLGLGETREEIRQAFADLRDSGVHLVTIGQYLQPSPQHLAIQKFYTGEEFKELGAIAEEYDFERVFAGPLVRSSYHAGELLAPSPRPASTSLSILSGSTPLTALSMSKGLPKDSPARGEGVAQ